MSIWALNINGNDKSIEITLCPTKLNIDNRMRRKQEADRVLVDDISSDPSVASW